MNAEELVSELVRSFPDLKMIGRVDRGFPVVEVEAEGLPILVEGMKSRKELAFDMLTDLTAVDWWQRRTPRFDVVYHFYSTSHNHRLRVKVAVDEGEEVPSLTPFYPIADWFEREVWDLYGIKFSGHPDLRRILLYEEFEGHPLRKDYPYDKRQPLIPETWPVRDFQVKLKVGGEIHRP